MSESIYRTMTNEHLRRALRLLKNGKYDVQMNIEHDTSIFDHTQQMPRTIRWFSLTIDQWNGADIAAEALAVLDRNAALELEVETLKAKLTGIRELAR